MDKTTMVGVEISKGAEVVEILDHANLKVSVALWAYLSEYEDWRLVIAGRHFDLPDPRDGYRVLREALESGGLTRQKTPPVLILPTTDPFVRELRRIFGKAKSVEGMRLGGQTIGDRFIHDAYVYRIS